MNCSEKHDDAAGHELSGRIDREAGDSAEVARTVESSEPTGARSELSASSLDPADTVLGEFQLIRRLGRGGMAEVYLADQTSLKRQVAIKVLRPDLIASDVHRKRFEREARAAATLNHPNIVQIFAIGESGGTLYIAQEYIHGGNLRQFLNRKGPPIAVVALRLMKQIALALHAAGEAGVIHRDIKPENIMVTRKGHVKVTDFGLAQLTRGTERLELTQSGVAVGTPLYMSPEQVNGRDLDQRSDVYSLGVTYYHLLAGRPPFVGETAMSVAAQHLHQTPAPLAECRPDLPPRLCQLVHQMMAKNRDDRLPDAKSVWKELTQIEKSLHLPPESAETLPELSDVPDSKPSGFANWFQQTPPKSLRLGTVALTCLSVFLVSTVIGRRTRPTDPLNQPLPVTAAIPKQDSAAAQFYLAMSLVDDEVAWKAIERYFPDATREIQLARSHLAVLELRSHRLDEAESLFTELTALRNVDPALQAKGVAGLAVIASLRADFQESDRLIELELLPQRELLDQEMQELVRGAIERNKQMRTDKLHQVDADLFRAEPDKRDSADR